MINIITKYSGHNIINDFESFFQKYVLSKDFSDIDLNVMKVIDNAILLDRSHGTIQTDFGITDIMHLSTGCKIVLSYLYIIRNIEKFRGTILNITEAGANALDVLFDCANKFNDDNTIFLLKHSNALRICKDRDYNINGHSSSSLNEGVALYG